MHLDKAIPWVLENAMSPPQGSQRERLAKAQAEKVEMENARRSGELVLVGVVSEILNGMAADIAGRLDALPGRVANELAGINQPAEIRARLLRETRGIRAGVAEYVAQLAESGGASEDGGDDLESAAGEDGESVGGSEPDTAAGEC